MENQTIAFLIQAYTSAVSYYNDYMNRIWNRFSIMLTVDVALAGLYITLWFRSESYSSKNFVSLPILGFLISCLLYAQSAQDRYVIVKLRNQINKLKDKTIELLGADKELPVLFSPFETEEEMQRKFVPNGITSWRISFISLTRLPAISSLIFMALWILVGIIWFTSNNA